MEEKFNFMVNPILYIRLGENPTREQIEKLLLEYKIPLEKDKISFENMKKLLEKLKDSIERKMVILDRLNRVLEGESLYDDWFMEYLNAPEELKREYEERYFEGESIFYKKSGPFLISFFIFCN